MIECLADCLLSRQGETDCRQKEGRVSVRECQVFFQLADHAIVVHHVVPPSICSGRIRGSVEDVSIACVDKFKSKEYGITHFKSDYLNL